MENVGRYIIVLGIVLVVVGILISFFDRIPLLGKLPGDIHFKRGNVQFYFPLATSLAISILLTILLRLIGRFVGK
ncbi:MAG: DUF2905 domain-containing protein [bacterium]